VVSSRCLTVERPREDALVEEVAEVVQVVEVRQQQEAV